MDALIDKLEGVQKDIQRVKTLEAQLSTTVE